MAPDEKSVAPSRATPPPRPRRRALRWLRTLGLTAALCALLGAAALYIAVRAWPLPDALLAVEPTQSVRLYDRHGRLLQERLNAQQHRGRWRAPEEIAPWVGLALIALEDQRFERHAGLDLRGIARAAWSNLRAGRVVAGGSTITQQVAGLLRPAPRGWRTKFTQSLNALRLERQLTKAQILNHYLNRAPFGQGTLGVEAAAQLYFGLSAQHLSLAQSALLAGIPKAPSLNNPHRDLHRALRRQRAALDRMHALGMIDASQRAEALAQPVHILPIDRPSHAGHWSQYVLRQWSAADGLDVHTSLDLSLNEAITQMAREEIALLEAHNVSQAAVVVLDNATGQALAWVGSLDFHGERAGQVDMVTGLRQPGSTLKPFVYGLALERDFTALTRLPDLPMEFATQDGSYRPKNYDKTFHGWVTLRAALANSYNIATVWLTQALGVPTLLERLRAVGFTTLTHDAEHYGLGLSLGNGEVRLIDLANAYRCLANEGRCGPWQWRKTAPGQPPEAPRPVMPPEVARLLTDILADPIARVPAFGRFGPLSFDFPVAAKTGTSGDFNDNWVVGYTPRVTVAVWVGNFEGQAMAGVSGVTGAGPLFHRVMNFVARDQPIARFSTEGLHRQRVCAHRAALWRPGQPGCGAATEEWFLRPLGAEGSATGARAQAGRLSVRWPLRDDQLILDVERPIAEQRIPLRARAPADVQALIFEVDGQPRAPVTRPFQDWWTPSPGRHSLRVYAEHDPTLRSERIEFEVLAPQLVPPEL